MNWSTFSALDKRYFKQKRFEAEFNREMQYKIGWKAEGMKIRGLPLVLLFSSSPGLLNCAQDAGFALLLPLTFLGN